MFSSRVPASLAPNRLAAAAAAAREAGRTLLDLTASDPTRAGLVYPADLLQGLGDAEGLTYRPAPLGLPVAREAVASDYARRGIPLSPSHVAITASTSEAYSLLFKVLCDPGDDVLVPRPGYPLFEHLTRLDAVRSVPYALEYHGVWSVDRAALDAALTERTRAVLVVAPNNPTGSLLRAADRRWLDERCAERGIAVIADEVFADYPLEPAPDAEPAWLPTRSAPGPRALGFSLGGLSKTVGLPQLKLGWIAAAGPPAAVAEALSRLELVCDTYLSVGTPVQLALRGLLQSGAAIRSAIGARLASNLADLRRVVSRFPACEVLRVEGGWSAVVRVPAIASEEELALALLERDGILVHPGFFFDFPDEAYLVVSLLCPPPEFTAGVERVCRRASGGA
jgi:alanine-synthesizing transaminase